MTELQPCNTKLLADCLSADKARLLVELIRSIERCLGERAGCEPIEVRDEAGKVLGFIMLSKVHAPAADAAESAEFLEELERRMQTTEPALPIEAVLDFLNNYSGGENAVTPN